MNIMITMDSKGILKNIDQKDIKDFIRSEWSKEDKGSLIVHEELNSQELWETLEIQLENEGKEIEQFIVNKLSHKSILRAIDNNEIEIYVSNYTDCYISNDIPDLMEQIHGNGNMDKVIELFTIKYRREESHG